MSVILGPLGTAPEEYDRVWMQQMLVRLEQILILLGQPAETGYIMTNVTTDRVLDADSTTTAELADVVGTLVDDLKAKGILA